MTKKKTNARSLANLTPGRKGKKFAPTLPKVQKVLISVLGNQKDSDAPIYEIFENLRRIATSGKDAFAIRAAELLLAYAYGRPKQQIDAEIKTINIDRAADDIQTIATEYSLLDAAPDAEENAD